MRKLREWEAAQPAPGAAPAAEPAKPPAQAVADQLGAQPADGAKPGEPAKPGEAAAPAAPEAAPPTPKQLADLLTAKPERQAFLDADPEFKGQVFSMARKLAGAEEVLALVPTKADAEFMQENSAAMVGLKAASMRLSVAPETAPQVLEMLDSQFAVVGADGRPVMGADGKPTYAADRKPFIDAVVGREVTSIHADMTAKIAALKAKVDTGVYPNEQARSMDQRRLDRLEYAQMWAEIAPLIMSGEYFADEAPEIPADATPEFKQWATEEAARLTREREELAGRKAGATKETRAAENATFQSAVRSDMGSSAGKVIGERLKEAIDGGTYIPEFYLQQKYVGADGQETKTADIVVRIFTAFENALMQPGSRTLLEIAQHELLPQNDQTRKMRADWYQRKAADLIPGLVTKEIERIQNLVKLDADKQAQRLGARTAAVQPEPTSASSALPQGATEAQLMTKAEELAKADPGFPGASPGDKQARIITQYHRLRSGRK